jgi:prepilin-type N-terminal cleavage/methylation domain-containing protein
MTNQRRHSDERGFTLVELLVGMAMALVVTAAAVTMFSSIIDHQSDSTQAADVIGTARNAAEKLTTDIREGQSATVPSPHELNLVTPCSVITAGATGSCEIKYRCAQAVGRLTASCTRESGGASRTVITGLSTKEIFCVYPTSEVGKECGAQGTTAPRYVGINLEFPNREKASGSSSTTMLEDGAALHNSPEVLAGL